MISNKGFLERIKGKKVLKTNTHTHRKCQMKTSFHAYGLSHLGERGKKAWACFLSSCGASGPKTLCTYFCNVNRLNKTGRQAWMAARKQTCSFERENRFPWKMATGGITWIQDQDERYWDSNPQSDTHELSDFGQVTQVAFSLTPTRKQQLKMNPSFHFCGESKNDLENNQKNKQRNKNKWD